MLIALVLQGALLQGVAPLCVAVHGGRLNVQGDSAAIAIAAALQRYRYVDQANCVVAVIEESRDGHVSIRLTLLATRYRPALEALGGGKRAEAFDMAARKLADQVQFWEPCWTSRRTEDSSRKGFSDSEYASLCRLTAKWLRSVEP